MMRIIFRRGFEVIARVNKKKQGFHGPTLDGISAVTSDDLVYFTTNNTFAQAKDRTGWDSPDERCLSIPRHETESDVVILWNEFTSDAEYYYYNEVQHYE
jgi:hypothetical protein